MINIAEAKTIAYENMGSNRIIVVCVKVMLRNGPVTLGQSWMAMTSTSTLGKIIAMWLPIMTFFGQGFDHTVVH